MKRSRSYLPLWTIFRDSSVLWASRKCFCALPLSLVFLMNNNSIWIGLFHQVVKKVGNIFIRLAKLFKRSYASLCRPFMIYLSRWSVQWALVFDFSALILSCEYPLLVRTSWLIRHSCRVFHVNSLKALEICFVNYTFLFLE